MTKFEGVAPALAVALEKRGYESFTPVQSAVLDADLVDADMLVSAQTGSGKTVAFGMAFAPNLLDENGDLPRADVPMALVVAPTRELALQVKRELEWLYGQVQVKTASCVGGMDMRTERRNLSHGAHIVVGTPGRLRDHIERGSFDTSGLQVIVLDEADEMLDMGFRDDLEYILDSAPKQRRTLMFSATVPRGIANLARRYQNDAVRIKTTADKEQHLDIEYRAFTIAPNDRENAIINVLRFYEAKNAIVFCGTRSMVNHMTSRFSNRGFSVVALSGELSQNERSHALQAMRDGRAQVCIATDVAARGIDLPNLELVIHADLPKNAESLLHRSGRTGRAGRKGVSALLVPHNARRRTERLLANASIKARWGKPPSVEEVVARDNERIMADPSLSEPLQDDEREFVGQLIANHSVEQIAAAFGRLYRAGKSAPEELLDASPSHDRPERKQRREDFEGGVWFSLSVGRKHNAEPRWLLPMLCRAGHITKREIGAIKIDQEETFVELHPDSVDKFLESIGPSAKVEKSVSVKRYDGVPSVKRQPQRDRKPFSKKKPYDRKPAGGKFKGKPKRGFDGFSAEKPGFGQNPFDQSGASPDQFDERKKYKGLKKKKKAKGKNAGKPPFSKSDSKKPRPDKTGSGPLKRRK
jgi:ATP-dependent RNA helicase DeaD